jgi:hypothetical protein
VPKIVINGDQDLPTLIVVVVEAIDTLALPPHRENEIVVEDAMTIVPLGLHPLADTEGTDLRTIMMVVVEVDLGLLTIELQDIGIIAGTN